MKIKLYNNICSNFYNINMCNSNDKCIISKLSHNSHNSNIEYISDGPIYFNNTSDNNIICKNVNNYNKKIILETFEEYLENISKKDFSKEQLIYDILDGITEQHKIIYKDDLIVIITDYNCDDLLKMHLLVYPMDRTLHTLRDLNKNHIFLLNYIKTKTLEIIKSIYNIDSNVIKIYIDYLLEIWHLHIHFALISNDELQTSCEYSYDLDTVINILDVKTDYYQSIKIKKIVNIS